MSNKQREVILVRWRDASSHNNWGLPENANLVDIESVGYLVFENDEVLKIAGSCGENLFNGIQVIPKSLISDRYVVKTSHK